ncbi:hypothetical protein F0562_032540 [Nyssa sinensis]|uniref:Uncharacterized protein n=1 Tax=Nyssa sinensis TaxID=561372 RepID=A0A5J5AQN2_9ASTE|nr:hypothetical protein F0562_032540 [Nyssa sinensis]
MVAIWHIDNDSIKYQQEEIKEDSCPLFFYCSSQICVSLLTLYIGRSISKSLLSFFDPLFVVWNTPVLLKEIYKQEVIHAPTSQPKLESRASPLEVSGAGRYSS